MKKFGLRALAGGLAVLMVAGLGTPAVAKAEDVLLIAPAPAKELKVLEITADMVDEDGEIVISGGEYDRVIITKEVDAKDIYFDQVKVKEMVVESGSNSNIQLWEIDAEKVTVQEPELKELTLQDLAPLLADDETRETAIEAYLNNRAEVEKIKKKVPKIVTKEDANVETMVARANVKLDLASGEVGIVALEANDKVDRAKVVLENYNGDVSFKGSENRSSLTLQSIDSRLKSLKVEESTAANNFMVNSRNSVIMKAEVAGNAKVSLNAMVGVVDIKETATEANVRLFSATDELNVEADGAKIEVAAGGSVAVATVTGDKVNIGGSGSLEAVEITGTGAYVSTSGTKVDGENTYVPPVYVEPVLPGTITDINLVPGEDVKVTKNADGSSNVYSEKQYKSATFRIPDGIDVSKIKSIKVSIESDRQCCIKVLDIDGKCLNDTSGYGGDFPNYGVTEMTAYNATYPIDASKNTVKQLDFMTTTTDPTNILVKKITFIMKEDGEVEVQLPDIVTYTYSDVTAKEGEGFAATFVKNEDGTVSISFPSQYASAGFMLPEKLNTEVYSHVKVDGTATGSLALKVWKVGETAASGNPTITKYGYNLGEALSLSKIFGEEVDRVDVTSMESGISATIKSITFAKSADLLKEESKEEAKPEAPKDLPENYLVYDVATLAPDAELTEQGGLKISFDKQYAGKNFTLPKALNVKDYSKMIITMSSATDAIAFKTFDDAETAAWYNKTATATTDVSVDLSAVKDQDSLVKQIGLMANNGACDVIFYRVAFVPDTPTYTEGPVAMGNGTLTADSGAKLLQNADKSVTIVFPETNAYNGATYAVPSNITVADIESIAINYTTTAQFGIKACDAEGTQLDINDYSETDPTAYVSYRANEDGAERTEGFTITDVANQVATLQFCSLKDGQPNVTINSITVTVKENASTPEVTVEIAEPAKKTLTVGETLQLTATASVSGSAITWSSANSSIASVGTDGTVTAVAAGTVKIKAAVSETEYAEVTLTVEEAIKEFYLAKEVAFTDVEVDESGNATLGTVWLNNGNFAKLLPDALKTDAELVEAFKGLGWRDYVNYFEFSYILTKGTAKEGGSQYDPQSVSKLQGVSSDGKTWSGTDYVTEWNGLGVPSEGTPKTATTKVTSETGENPSYNLKCWANWTSDTIGQAAATVTNAKPGTTVSGSYSIKVVLK